MSSGLAFVRGAAPVSAPVRRRRFDDLPASPKLEVRPAFDNELPQLASLLTELVPGLVAPYASFSGVHSYSRSIYTVMNLSSLVGCFACLHMNAKGIQGLLDGSLSMFEPQHDCLAESGTRVEAIYAWAWAIRPPTNGIRAMGNFMAWLQRPEFREAEIYAKPTTEKGFGFVVQNLESRPVESSVKGQGLWVSTRFA
ncbi:MAG: hypothetical protein WBS22_07860 [Methylocystis sp.]